MRSPVSLLSTSCSMEDRMLATHPEEEQDRDETERVDGRSQSKLGSVRSCGIALLQ